MHTPDLSVLKNGNNVIAVMFLRPEGCPTDPDADAILDSRNQLIAIGDVRLALPEEVAVVLDRGETIEVYEVANEAVAAGWLVTGSLQ